MAETCAVFARAAGDRNTHVSRTKRGKVGSLSVQLRLALEEQCRSQNKCTMIPRAAKVVWIGGVLGRVGVEVDMKTEQ